MTATASRRTDGRLQPANRHTRPTVEVLLEDRLHAAKRLAELALGPRAPARDALHELVREQRRLGLRRDLHARRRAGGLERPCRPRPVAVELARAPGRDDLVRALDLDEGHVAPRVAVHRRVDLEARARPTAVGLDTRH